MALAASLARPTSGLLARRATQPAPRRAALTVVRASAEPAKKPAVIRPHPVKATSSVPDVLEVMGFNGSAPELINGRLAMLGFFSALVVEVFSGKTVGQQLSGSFGSVVTTFAIWALATLVPILRGAKNEAFGPFSPEKELINGRAAMVGFASLIVIEAFKGAPLF